MKLPPLREEWDFEAYYANWLDDDPKSQTSFLQKLHECFAYEYARSLPHVVKTFRDDKRLGRRIVDGAWHCYLVLPTMPIAALDATLELLDTSVEPWDELEFFPGLSPVRLIAPEGFPKTPYLKLGNLDQPKPASLETLVRPASVTSVTEQRGIYIDNNGWAYQHNWVSMVHVNWHDCDDVIIKSFRDWVAKARPKPAAPMQGKSIRRELAANLKALGTWRLLHAFDGDIQKATDYCQKSSGKNHFVRREDWWLMSLRAQRILKDFSLREIRG